MAERNSRGDPSTMPMFLEDVYDALKAAVQKLGWAKAVGEKLWPNKTPEQARGDLLDCLNRNNARKFEAEEILAILRMANEAGYHEAKHWIDHATGYQSTPPLDPVIERDRLAESLERAAQTFEQLSRDARALLEREQKVKAIR